MRKVPIKLSELAEIWTMANDESSYYLNLVTGQLEFYWLYGDNSDLDIEEIQNSPDWLELPRDDSQMAYQDMEAFIEKVNDKHVAELLRVAIAGKGAFRRFKDVLLNYPQARDSWFAFQTECISKRIKEWLSQNDLEVSE